MWCSWIFSSPTAALNLFFYTLSSYTENKLRALRIPWSGSLLEQVGIMLNVCKSTPSSQCPALQILCFNFSEETKLRTTAKTLRHDGRILKKTLTAFFFGLCWDFFWRASVMLRVVVESASGLPKKKLGSPDPITSVVFKGNYWKRHTERPESMLFTWLNLGHLIQTPIINHICRMFEDKDKRIWRCVWYFWETGRTVQFPWSAAEYHTSVQLTLSVHNSYS